MEQLTKAEQYQLEIYQLFLDAFNREREEHKWDINQIDATAWFTGFIRAGGFLYNKLTNGEKTYFEFTHIAQNLVVQDMLESMEAAS